MTLVGVPVPTLPRQIPGQIADPCGVPAGPMHRRCLPSPKKIHLT
jgi:hypothetical protein